MKRFIALFLVLATGTVIASAVITIGGETGIDLIGLLQVTD